ncbi:imm11 family protein [Flavobacterium cerinum]|uniref:Immunity MXAN-0049 protein domain-containing protein n=1 Tax=Flavobacterium cerinum TaxID=2502784 RepID=A0ABY5IYE4_9FLAO|nr:DUF1629 domain-containing protein [Flavobacterium cerinum]UUC47167.1 hypothetical protein NOX80_08200 [Flavobacterium cerinum]
MKKVNYYKINYSVDKKITGAKDSQIINFIDPENNSVERTKKYSYIGLDHVDSSLDFTKFKADDKAKVTDILSSNFFSSYYIISEKFKKIIEDFTFHNVRFLDSVVTFKNNKYNYFILSIIERIDIVDFSKSTLILDRVSPMLRFGGDIIEVTSSEDYSLKSAKIWDEKGFGYGLIPTQIVLNYRSDLVKLPFGITLISEELKQKIEEEKLTGIVFEKTESEFYLKD